MPVISVRIPQLGEGLQEARLVEFLKRPGEIIKRDDPIYVMETDKAVSEVESPYDGKLVEWVAEPNSVLPIGSEIAKMEVAEGVEEIAAGHGPPSHDAHRSAVSLPSAPAATAAPRDRSGSNGHCVRPSQIPIPPRTRKYLREKGLLDKADQIPAAGKKLMPEDVDRYLENPQEALRIAAGGGEGFDVSEVPARKQTLELPHAAGCAGLCGCHDFDECRLDFVGRSASAHQDRRRRNAVCHAAVVRRPGRAERREFPQQHFRRRQDAENVPSRQLGSCRSHPR